LKLFSGRNTCKLKFNIVKELWVKLEVRILEEVVQVFVELIEARDGSDFVVHAEYRYLSKRDEEDRPKRSGSLRWVCGSVSPSYKNRS
jgi:hypothetical protein